MAKPHLCECGESDPNNFYKNQKGRCKKCQSKVETDRYHDVPLEPKRILVDGEIKYGGNSRVRQRWLAARSRANRRHLDFELTEEWVMQTLRDQNYKCHYSGLPLSDFSIDRIDSNGGYTYENVVLSHIDINYMKNNLSVDYFMYLIRCIYQYQYGDQKVVPIGIDS
jgi:hypothetical protein